MRGGGSAARSDDDARTAGIRVFNQLRKQRSRQKLLAAAIKLFCRDGYAAVSIEDITTEASVSRITYYRHFPSKAAIESAPRMRAIGAVDYRDRTAVVHWLSDFFAADRDVRGILRVLSQANIDEADFSRKVQPFIAELIAGLGQMIPAFALDRNAPAAERRWLRAWLLVYTILDQSNHAATRSGVANDLLMIELLADTFLDFVGAEDGA